MFDWFRRAQTSSSEPKELAFKGSQEAFSYASEYLSRPLEQGSVLIGQVLGPGGVKVGDFDVGGNWYSVRLATQGGIVEVTNCGTSLDDQTPPDSIVAVEAAVLRTPEDPGHYLNYFVILARLQPILLVEENFFKVVE